MMREAGDGGVNVSCEGDGRATSKVWEASAMAGRRHVGGNQGQCGAAGSLHAVVTRCIVSDG